MYPKALKELMDNLEKLPSIGPKTAERLALFILSDLTIEDANEMAHSIQNAVATISSKSTTANCLIIINKKR